MQSEEIKKIEEILSLYTPHLDVLEWGSGGSTVYFTKFLREKGISYTWTSMEYNKSWYEKILNALNGDSNVRLFLFDVGNNDNKQRNKPMNEYVSFPSTLSKKYDLIFVDGRKRRRCLIEAASLLKPNGAVLLHDARRTYYHCAFRKYPNRRILLRTGLWLGKLENPGFIQKIINGLIYLMFRVYTFSFRLLPI